jgi:hypothetical protein
VIAPVGGALGVGDNDATAAVVDAAVGVDELVGAGEATVAGEPHAASSAMSVSSRIGIGTDIIVAGCAVHVMTLSSSAGGRLRNVLRFPQRLCGAFAQAVVHILGGR